MNANELADVFENDYWDSRANKVMLEGAKMLRQQQAEINNWKDQYQRLNENLEMWKDGHFKQQAEIEALKQIIDANNLNQNIGQFVKPTNEPVAWMHQNPDYAISKHQSLEYNIPLYTHPVSKAKDRFPNYESICLQCGTTIYKPFKELTDEEINEIVWQQNLLLGNDDLRKFAKAILRKASEK